MKKIIYTLVLGLGFLATSCSKECIKPNSQKTETNPSLKMGGAESTTSTTSPLSITDPNNDPETYTKVRKKKQ